MNHAYKMSKKAFFLWLKDCAIGHNISFEMYFLYLFLIMTISVCCQELFNMLCNILHDAFAKASCFVFRKYCRLIIRIAMLQDRGVCRDTLPRDIFNPAILIEKFVTLDVCNHFAAVYQSALLCTNFYYATAQAGCYRL